MDLYIFDETSRASSYGVGTYMTELVNSLKDYTDLSINIVCLYADQFEFQITHIDNVCYWFIPRPVGLPNTNTDPTICCKSVISILQLYIKTECQLIFQFNFIHSELATELKKHFKVCKTLMVVHYFSWAFHNNGNETQLKAILNNELPNEKEKMIKESFRSDQKAFNAVDHIVCLSQHNKEFLIREMNIASDKITIVHNGILDSGLCKADTTALKKKYYITDTSEKHLFFVGRIDEIKGVNLLVEAFKLVLGIYPNCRLWIIGDGDFNSQMKLGQDIWTKITFTGKVNKDQLSDLYTLADIGIIPSYYEPFGYVALEMMMNEIPIIATSTAGLGEIVQDQITGYTIDRTESIDQVILDPNLLADRIIHLLTTEVLAKEMGQSGRGRYLAIYTSKTMGENMLNCYRGMIGSRKDLKKE